MKIAVIAPGAMGAAVAQRLRRGGADVATTLEGRSPASAERASGLALHETEVSLAQWADLVLSILPPGDARALAARLAPVLVPRTGQVVFADCNAVNPATVRRVADELPGVAFLDIGIIGGPPAGDGAGPRFYASGVDGGDAMAALRAGGIDVRPMEGGIGAASALKMSYAGITKGITALGSAMALGADRAGVAQALRAELQASQPEALRYLDRSVPGMFDKAYRWVAEMEEIAGFLADLPGGRIYEGAADLYASVATDRAAPAPDGAVARLEAFFARKYAPD
jgi:L-threonate 2-dehydrogenase